SLFVLCALCVSVANCFWKLLNSIGIDMSGILEQTTNILLLIFGFGFVIFWHELGHFLAAKWAGVRVEQFAVGFGQALISWRKGIGFKWGSTAREFENRIEKHLAATERTELELKEKVGITSEQQNRA